VGKADDCPQEASELWVARAWILLDRVEAGCPAAWWEGWRGANDVFVVGKTGARRRIAARSSRKSARTRSLL
jgi:hypothetical protein